MNAPLDRIDAERVFHDRQAAERAKHFTLVRSDLVFRDADYLDHETWIRPAMAKLGDVSGKSILDYGCGHGMAATVLARGGANVSAFDLSPGYVEEAKNRAMSNGVNVRFAVANGERLPYADESFDGIWGSAILHHLDLSIAGPELLRVLTPGGVAVFCEPWDGNRLLALARKWLPYPGKHRTPDEQPLTDGMLDALRVLNVEFEIEPHQWLGMMGRIWRHHRLKQALAKVDRQLFRRFATLRTQCRYVVVTIRKPKVPEKTEGDRLASRVKVFADNPEF